MYSSSPSSPKPCEGCHLKKRRDFSIFTTGLDGAMPSPFPCAGKHQQLGKKKIKNGKKRNAYLRVHTDSHLLASKPSNAPSRETTSEEPFCHPTPQDITFQAKPYHPLSSGPNSWGEQQIRKGRGKNEERTGKGSGKGRQINRKGLGKEEDSTTITTYHNYQKTIKNLLAVLDKESSRVCEHLNKQ